MARDKLAKLKALLEKDRLSREYKREQIILELGETIVCRMKELNINRAELAKRLGVSNAMVTKMLRGNTNFTLMTLINLASALELNLSPIEFAPLGFTAKRFYVSTEYASAADYSKQGSRVSSSRRMIVGRSWSQREGLSTAAYKHGRAKQVSLAGTSNGKVA